MNDGPGAFVLGLSPTGLYAVRELARAGVAVIGVGTNGEPGLRSRFLREPGGRWQLRDANDVVERLMARPLSGARPVLFPTNDTFIEILNDHRDELAERFAFAGSYGAVAERLMDKRGFHALCAEHGVETARVWTSGTAEELSRLAPEFSFPCILKPLLIHRARRYLSGEKVLLIRSAVHLAEVVRAIPDDTGGWLVQEIIPGPESDIVVFGGYFDRAGEVRQAFTGRKLRQYPPGFGSASLVISEELPEIVRATARLLKAIGFHGVCGSEFKRDARDGRLKMIEINPRPTLWFQTTNAAGKRIMLAAFRDLSGQSLPAEVPMKSGVVWRYALKDLASAFFYRYRSEGFVLPRPDVTAARGRTASTWAVMDRSDPLPAVAEAARYVSRWRERR